MELTAEQKRQEDLLLIANAVINNVRFNKNGMMSMTRGGNTNEGTWSVQDLFSLEKPSLKEIISQLKKTKANIEEADDLYENPQTKSKTNAIDVKIRIARIAVAIYDARKEAMELAEKQAKEKAERLSDLKNTLKIKRIEKDMSKDTSELEAEIAKLEAEQKTQ